MPVFTCGGMRYQHSWRDQPASEIPDAVQQNLAATIEHSLAVGINHIETARGYGTSELQLGFVLPKFPRDQLIVQTKVGPSEDVSDFLKNFEKSLKLLQLDHVDLLALHGINNRTQLDWSLRKGGCLEAALALKKQGLARHIGFSTHGTSEVILAAIRSGEFEYVNLHYYYVNPLNLVAVKEAHRFDMGVFIISPTDKGGQLYSPPAKLVELVKPLSPIAFNDLFCLSHPEVHTLSIGAARPSDLDEHVAALAHYENMDEILKPITLRLQAALETALGREWCERWPLGIPEYDVLPGKVNVREILRLYTYAKGLDLVDWGKARYNLLGRGEDWVPGQNAATLDEPALLSALAERPFASQQLRALHDAHELLFDRPLDRLSQS